MKYLLKLTLIFTLIMCLGCGSGGGGGGENGGNDSEEPSEQPKDPGVVLLNPTFDPTLPVRGVGFFPLLHPKVSQPAPNGIVPLDGIIEVLRESSNPGFSFPMQTFGSQIENYTKVVDSLLAVGKKPTISIYAICGPCRKGRGTGEWEYFYPNLNIEQMQDAIRHNEQVRNSFVNLLNKIQDLIIMYPDLKFVIYPELEDNQTDASFKAMLDLTVMVFGSFPNVEIRRNPLGRYGTNSFGLHIEKHGTSIGTLRQLRSGDSLNFDGSDFNFPDENYSGDPSFDDTKNLVIEARATGKELYVWRPEWQGRQKNLGGGSVHPDLRTYVVDHIAELKELMVLP